MNSPFLPSVLMVLPLLSSVSATGDSREGCDTKAAAQCMTYSEVFMSLPEDLQHTECANANKSVTCLEELVARCPSLSEEDEELYTFITDRVAGFKAETVDMCAAGVATLCASSVTVMTSWLLGLWLLHFTPVAGP